MEITITITFKWWLWLILMMLVCIPWPRLVIHELSNPTFRCPIFPRNEMFNVSTSLLHTSMHTHIHYCATIVLLLGNPQVFIANCKPKDSWLSAWCIAVLWGDRYNWKCWIVLTFLHVGYFLFSSDLWCVMLIVIVMDMLMQFVFLIASRPYHPVSCILYTIQ